MDFNYNEMNKEYEEALKKKIYDYLDQFEESCKKFEEEYDVECENNVAHYYRLDDEELKMVDELAEETNCTWQQAVSDAILWYHDWRINQSVMNDIAKEIADCAPEVEEKKTSEYDDIKRPMHYLQGGMECIEEMILVFGLEEAASFCKLNTWKYRNRAPFKENPAKDMDKSNQYLKMYKEIKKKIEEEKHHCRKYGIAYDPTIVHVGISLNK